MSFQPDWQYLRQELEWHRQQVRDHLDQADIPGAEFWLARLEHMARALERFHQDLGDPGSDA